ncbi:N-acetylmuramoyl-L-alanine amidase, partial [Fertoeibacter niger]
MIYQGNARYPVHEAIIHSSDTRPGWLEAAGSQAKLKGIRRWHVQENGWKDVGYHWLIDRDGTLLCGRLPGVIGAHVAGRNAGTLGICLIGGFGSKPTDRFAQHFTPVQDLRLRGLLATIRRMTDLRYIVRPEQITQAALTIRWRRSGALMPQTTAIIQASQSLRWARIFR